MRVLRSIFIFHWSLLDHPPKRPEIPPKVDGLDPKLDVVLNNPAKFARGQVLLGCFSTGEGMILGVISSTLGFYYFELVQASPEDGTLLDNIWPRMGLYL